MSTNALIVFKNVEGICDCISVHWDGCIENGVGEQLYRSWTDVDSIKHLCSFPREIRCFDTSFDKIEFYPYDIERFQYIMAMKNLSLDEVKGKSGNYSYTYLWEEETPGWKVLLPNSHGWRLNLISEILK